MIATTIVCKAASEDNILTVSTCKHNNANKDTCIKVEEDYYNPNLTEHDSNNNKETLQKENVKEKSEIIEFYNGKSILITGASGFLGKAIVEKLLKTATQLKAIYILIRPNNKTGSDVKARLAELINSPLFETLKSENAELLNKIIPIAGDISLPELGISNEDQQLLCNEVSVVIHSAAILKFNENLKTAINVNVNGTKRVLELCKRFKNLLSMVYVSTAYSNCDRHEIAEKIYPAAVEPSKIIKMVEKLSDEDVDKIASELIGNKPNNYTFTKALAELILNEGSTTFPITIVRPSIVTATSMEPMSGWIDNINGPTGLMSAVGKGVLRTALCNIKKVVDIIPLDYTVNFIIAAAWRNANTNTAHQLFKDDIVVYNCCSGAKNQLLWGDFRSLLSRNIIKHPFNDILWYPAISFITNQIWSNVNEVFVNYIPAYLIDLLIRVTGKKPRMVKIHKKISKTLTALKFFAINDFKFSTNNVLELYQNMNSTDQKLFNFNVEDINWPDYMEKYWLGIRRYIFKQDESTLPEARKQLQRKYWLHKILQLLLILLFLSPIIIIAGFFAISSQDGSSLVNKVVDATFGNNNATQIYQ